jgi:hypothetical protein
MAHIALLTLETVGDFVIDDAIAVTELERRGHTVASVPWTRDDTDWSTFDGVIVRTTWDYHEQPERFLAAIDRIARATPRFANDVALIRWNLDKRYLRELAARGAPIVPSVWGEGGDDHTWPQLAHALQTTEFVVKPAVSANAMDTFRLHAPLSAEMCATLSRTFEGRAWFAQPFLHSIVTEGEFSAFYFGGTYSHCIVKVPKAGDFRVQEEHGGLIRGVSPAPEDVRAASDAVMRAMTPAPLQARVDLARLADGSLALMELEMIEPSLYFRTDPAAPTNFADAVEAWLLRPVAS